MPYPPHAVSPQEWPALRTAINAVFRPNGGDLTAECPLLFDEANRANLRVITRTPPVGPREPSAVAPPLSDAPSARGDAEGEVVAHIGWVMRDALAHRRKFRVMSIGAVFTRPDARGHCLATQLLEQALARAESQADLVLVSGDRGLYRRHGLVPIPALLGYRFRRIVWPVATAGPAVEVREAREVDLEAMAALYDAEDVHFRRDSDDWSRLWRAARLVDAPARFWIVGPPGRRPVGYLAVQERGRRGGGSGGRRRRARRILELAGDRAALLRVAPTVADELAVPPYDSATRAGCADQGWPESSCSFPMTARLMNPDVPAIPWYGLNYV